MDMNTALDEAAARYVRGKQEGLKPLHSLAHALTWLILTVYPNVHPAALACGVRVGIGRRKQFSGTPGERLRAAFSIALKAAEDNYAVVRLGVRK